MRTKDKLIALIPCAAMYGHARDVRLTDRYSFSVELRHDEDMGPPWKEHDGHGPVSDWRPKNSKRPGERVLAEERGSALFYDFAEAVRIARRDGWGASGDEGMRAGAKAAHAAEADFRRLRAWCRGDWMWIWIDVRLWRDGKELQRATCGGVESDSDYWREVAADLLSECLCAAREYRRKARALGKESKRLYALRRCFC